MRGESEACVTPVSLVGVKLDFIMNQDPQEKLVVPGEPGEAAALEEISDPVEEASLESFPASDPPAWNSSGARPLPLRRKPTA